MARVVARAVEALRAGGVAASLTGMNYGLAALGN